ncbi:hypothetical protein H4Q26_010805, partial [Puccinia striiformis f. sp. tritici PST-130]
NKKANRRPSRPTTMKKFIFATSLWMISLIAGTGGAMISGFLLYAMEVPPTR